MKEGAKIVSSKAFCPLNFRITDRNLTGELSVLFFILCLGCSFHKYSDYFWLF